MLNSDVLPSLPEFNFDTAYPFTWDLYQYQPNGIVLYRQLANWIFVISNGTFAPESTVETFGVFGGMLNLFPSEVLEKTFQDRALSVRAVWDRFITNCVELCVYELLLYWKPTGSRRVTLDSIGNFISFVSNVFPDWIINSKDELLILVVLLRRSDLVRKLLAGGARASRCHPRHMRTPLMCATIAEDYESFRLLIARCDINTRHIRILTTYRSVRSITAIQKFCFSVDEYAFVSEFDSFLDIIRAKPAISRLDNSAALLEILLDRNAGVDAPCPFNLYGLHEAYREDDVRPDWLPSRLDVSFYYGDKYYEQMRAQSRKSTDSTLLTREGVCNATRLNQAGLTEYLDSRTAYSALEKAQFLELVLLEQFFLRRDTQGANLNEIAAEYARFLLDYGVAIKRPVCRGPGDTLPLLWLIWSRSVGEYGLSECLQVIMDHLIRQGCAVTSDLIADQISQGELERLDMLMTKGALQPSIVALNGLEALVTAAKMDDYESVSWLLRMGVDINAGIQPVTTAKSNTAPPIAICLGIGRDGEWKASWLMCQYMVDSGAKLKLYQGDATCYELLEEALCQPKQKDALSTLRFFQEFPSEFDKITRWQWNMLVRKIIRCGRPPPSSEDNREPIDWTIIEYLLDQHLDVEHGPILSNAIAAGCPPSILRLLLDRGTDVNEEDAENGTPVCAAVGMFRFNVARQLLELGADISRCIESTQNALCRAIVLEPSSAAEKCELMDFIRLLIAQGLDVNQRSGGPDRTSTTPLNKCASSGDLDTASLLLRLGADPNILEWRRGLRRYMCCSALDIAAKEGRLDMTQLLLQSGAVSSEPGSTGYDGTLRRARILSYHTVVELLLQHVSQNERKFSMRLDLQVQHQANISGILAQYWRMQP